MKWAQIIGVTLRDTTADMQIANVSVMANSCSRRPTTPVMNSTGMKAATRRHRDRDDGEADLARALEGRLHGLQALLQVGSRRSRS